MFLHRLLEDLTVEVHHASVGPNCSRSYVLNVRRLFRKDNFHICFLLDAFFGEDFYANVLFVRVSIDRCSTRIDMALTVENHGVGAGLGGVVFERQVSRGNGEPIVTGVARWEGPNSEQYR